MPVDFAAATAPDDLVQEFLSVLAARFARVVWKYGTELPVSAESGRTWKKLGSTSMYDVWLIVWPPGSEIPDHDHGSSTAALSVVAGSLVNRPANARARLIPAGAVATVPARDRHAVQNAGTSVAVSVHVYSPPLGDDWRP